MTDRSRLGSVCIPRKRRAYRAFRLFFNHNHRAATLASKKKALNFEESLQTLEKLVTDLEKGDLSLEDSLKTFEEGIALTRHCQTALQEAEQKVQLLTEQNGEISSQPFDNEG